MEQSTAGAADAAAVQLSSAAGPAAAAHRAADHQQSRRLSQHCRPYRRQLLHPACAATTSVSSAPKYKDELCETRWTTSLPVHLKPRGRSWNVHARPYLPKHHAPAKSFESPQTQHSSSCSFPYHYCRPPALSAAALPPTVEPRPSPCRHPHAFRKLITMSSPTSSTSIMFSSSLSSPTSPSAMLASSSPSKPSTVWQGQLADHCKTSHKRGAVYNIISDRRGGRTAWSCTVTVEDAKYVPVAFSARYWYDGQYVNNAKEDAAEVALQQLGVVPGPRHRYL